MYDDILRHLFTKDEKDLKEYRGIFGERKVHNILTLTTNEWFKNDTLKEQKNSQILMHTKYSEIWMGSNTRACLLVCWDDIRHLF